MYTCKWQMKTLLIVTSIHPLFAVFCLFTQFPFDETKMEKKKKLCFCDENDDKIYECGQKVQISMLSDFMYNTVIPARFTQHEWNTFCTKYYWEWAMSNNKQIQRHIMMSICLHMFSSPIKCLGFDCLFTNQLSHNFATFNVERHATLFNLLVFSLTYEMRFVNFERV